MGFIFLINELWLRFTFELVICEVPFLLVYPKADSPRRRKIAALLLGLAVSYFWSVLWSPVITSSVWSILYYIGIAVITFLVIPFLFDTKSYEALYIVTSGYAVEHIVFAFNRIMAFSFHVPPTVQDSLPFFWAVNILPYIIAAGIAYRLLVRPNVGKLSFKPGDKRLIILSLAAMLAAIILSVFYNAYGVIKPQTYLTEIICPLYGILCCILVIALQHYVLHENRMELEQEMMEQMLQMARQQQKSSREAIDIINIKCHDIKHWVRHMQSDTDPGQKKEYMKEIQKAVDMYDAIYHTGNAALDYVLREKNLLAKECNTDFRCMADGKAISFISDPDLYALVGNILDNAIGRQKKEPEEKRYIQFRTKRRGNMVLLHEENTCSAALKFQDGLPVTDKADRAQHGFGMRSIRYIARKYGGTLSVRAEDGLYQLDILFVNKL